MSKSIAKWYISHVCHATPHDDVIKWKHCPRYWPFVRGIHRSPVNSPHKGQWRGALMFSFTCAWINGWVNNREAGDLRRQRADYDVIVMPCDVVFTIQIGDELSFRRTSDISRTVVGNTLVDWSALLQLHFHSRLNKWLQWIGQRQLQDRTGIFKFCDMMCLY